MPDADHEVAEPARVVGDGGAAVGRGEEGAEGEGADGDGDGARGVEPAGHDPECTLDRHCALCDSNSESPWLTEPERKHGCCGKVPCRASSGDIDDVVYAGAVEAAEAASDWARRAGREETANKSYRYHAYRLLAAIPDLMDDNRGDDARRVALNACVLRRVRQVFPGGAGANYTGFKRAGDGANAPPAQRRRQ